MKKILQLITSACMFCSMITWFPVQAQEEPGFDDREYWNNKCTVSSTDYDEAGCSAYTVWLSESSDSYRSSLQEIEAKRDAIAADIVSYGAQIQQYEAEIDALQVEIDGKQAEINAKQAEIDAKQAEIDAKQLEIDHKQTEIDDTNDSITTAKEKVKKRMVSAQSTMRLNKMTDVLFGANTFEEFLRIANGLTAINDYDQKAINDLLDLVDLLNVQKQEMETAKAEMEQAKQEMEVFKEQLEVQKGELQEQQEVVMAKKYEIEVIEQEAKKLQAALRAQASQISAGISEISSTLTRIAASGKLDSVPNAGTTSWYFPVDGAYKSGGTWYYMNGIEHLGVDLAAPVGTPIRAVGNGVVVISANGCPTYGYYGNYCAGATGVGGGGNQIYLVTVINGSLYGVQYFHMMLNSPIALGSVVSAGEVIGYVGASGNVTGPHCHVEIIYLGDGSNFANYVQHYNGDLTFGAGWGSPYGDGRKCDAGYSAPCRVRPETVLGI